jgi:hypothetical protein
MSYRDDDQGGTTAQFQAFVHGQADGSATQTWETNASKSRSKAWTIGAVVAVVVVIAVVAILFTA